MIIERKPKVSLVEEIEVKEVKPSEAVLNVEMKESKKCENIIECADRKEVAEQRTKLKEQNIKHKVSKVDGKFIIECFDKVEEEKKSLKEEWQYCNCKDLDEVAKLSDYCAKNGCKITAKTSTNDGYKCRIEGPFDNVHKVNDKWSMFKWKGTSLEESLNETFAGEDIIADLVDRAKSKVNEGEEAYEAIHSAIDEGLIYTKDIYNLLEHYGTIEDGAIIESYYDELYSDIAKGLGVTESLTENADGMSTADIEKKVNNIKKGITADEDRILKMKAEKEESKDEKRKHTLDNKIEDTEKKIAKDKEILANNEDKLAMSIADDNEKIRKEFVEKAKKVFNPGKGHKASQEEIKPTEEEIKAYDSLADFLKDNVTIHIETSKEKEATLKKMLPDLEEGQYRVVSGETSGGYPMKFGISMTLHANSLEGCPEEFKDMFKEGDLTTVEEVYGILRTHFDDFKDSIGPKKKDVKQDEVKPEEIKQESVEVKEASNKDSLKSKIESKLLSYIKKLGYDEKDFNDYFVVDVKDFVNDEGDKATHVQIRNDLVDFYEAEEEGLVSDLEAIVKPGYFEPYDAYVWDAYVWDFEKEEKRDLVKDLEDAIEYRKAHESLDESMSSEVTKWWKDVEDANVENKWEFKIDNGDYSDVEAMHAAMFDMLDDLKEKGAFDLFEKGKKIYNKYAKYSKYNESLEDDIEIEVEEPVVDEVDDEVVYFSIDEVKDVVEDVVDEIGDEMKDKEPEEVDVKEIIDEKIADAVEEKKEEESEKDSEEEVVADFSDDDMSEEDAQFFENLTISNNYKNEVKSESTEQTSEIINESVVIKDDLGVSEDLTDEDDLSDLIKDYSKAE